MSAAYRLRTPDSFHTVLTEYGQATREALLRFLPKQQPRRYLYDLIADYPQRGGRYMRPAILIACANAHGASTERALATAVFVELLHNALLVIDDIQDGSEERRGQPTLHRQHGMPIALNAGSTMSILSLVPLLRNVGTNGPHLALWIFEHAIGVAQNSAEGQAMELGWRADNRIDISEAEYLEMVLHKTCAYSTMFPLRVGAMLGTHRRDANPAVLRFGFLIGAAFQIQDDLLNLAGDHERYGKELRGDLLEGKRTLLTIRLLECCSPEERSFFAAVMAKEREDKSDRELDKIVAMLHAYECIENVRAKVQAMIGAAQHEFIGAFEHLPPSRDKEFLRHLTTWIVEQT